MALTTLIPANVTVVSSYCFGGGSGKKRKQMTATINDLLATSGGAVVGANPGDIPVSIFPGFSKIDSCSSLNIFTTSTGVTARIYSAVPDLLGTSIMLSDSGQTAGAASDATIATTESAQITIVGY